MHNLIAVTPLGGLSPLQDTVADLTIAEATDVALASVTTRLGQHKAFKSAAKKLFGTVLPQPGHWVQGPDFALIWIGPDQWFAEANFTMHEDIAQIVRAALGGTASVTEQTDGWARFDVAGAKIVDTFERLSVVNTGRMGKDHATCTLISHMTCYVICREPARRISIVCPRSSAGSIHQELIMAARSVA